MKIDFNFNDIWLRNGEFNLKLEIEKQKELEMQLEKYKEENKHLKEEYEKYKIRTNYLIKSAKHSSQTSQESSQETMQQIQKLKDEIEVLKKRILIIEKENQEEVNEIKESNQKVWTKLEMILSNNWKNVNRTD